MHALVGICTAAEQLTERIAQCCRQVRFGRQQRCRLTRTHTCKRLQAQGCMDVHGFCLSCAISLATCLTQGETRPVLQARARLRLDFEGRHCAGQAVCCWSGRRNQHLWCLPTITRQCHCHGARRIMHAQAGSSQQEKQTSIFRGAQASVQAGMPHGRPTMTANCSSSALDHDLCAARRLSHCLPLKG